MTPELEKLLSPARLGGLELRKRVIKTATFEGMTREGIPTRALMAFHAAMAEGGVALTTVGQCNVSADARNLDNQMYFHSAIRPQLRDLTSAVHEAGAKVSAQLTHCGFFKQNKPIESPHALAPSFHFNKLGAPYGRPFAYPMSRRDIAKVADDYVRTAEMACEVGFDAVELLMGHGYLLSQFISANINKRSDEYGGSLANRMRLPMQIVERIHAALGRDFPVLAKINLDDACRGGIRIDDAVEVAKWLEQAGIDGIVTTAGRSPGNTAFMFRGDTPMPAMIRLQTNPLSKVFLKLFGRFQYVPLPYEEMYLLDMARRIRAAVECAVIYLGGVSTVASLEAAMREGFDFVAMGRALIKDPQMVNRLRRGGGSYRNGCTHCNQCVALIYSPTGVHCVLSGNKKRSIAE